jgi:hypothetical protein
VVAVVVRGEEIGALPHAAPTRARAPMATPVIARAKPLRFVMAAPWPTDNDSVCCVHQASNHQQRRRARLSRSQVRPCKNAGKMRAFSSGRSVTAVPRWKVRSQRPRRCKQSCQRLPVECRTPNW